MKIAVDAMGGDYAPAVTVDGGLEAARKADGAYEVVFVGDQNAIEQEIARHRRASLEHVSIVHASEAVEMCESPLGALKSKPDSSILVAQRC